MYKKYEEKLDKERFEKEKAFIHDNRNKMEHCPYCNHNIKDRKVALFKELIDALYKVYVWCGKNRQHEFQTKDIRHLFDKTQYNRFGDLVRFGGIIYKPKRYGKSKKALYGINMARAKEFFHGQRDMPLQIILDQITGDIVSEAKRGKVNDFPELSKLMGVDGLYDHEIPIQEVLLKA